MASLLSYKFNVRCSMFGVQCSVFNVVPQYSEHRTWNTEQNMVLPIRLIEKYFWS